MGTKGGQIGNQNAKLGREFRDAMRKSLASFTCADLGADGPPKRIIRGTSLAHICNNLVRLALHSDLPAIREIADRLDGKPSQAITGPDDGPLIINVEGAREKLLAAIIRSTAEA